MRDVDREDSDQLVEPGVGDIVINSTHEGHFVQVLPNIEAMKFKMLDAAITFADRWAVLHPCIIWNHINGHTLKVRDRRTPH